MAMSGSGLEVEIKDDLKNELKNQLQALFSIEIVDPAPEWFDKFCQAVAYSCAKVVADKTVTHIQNNAEVQPGIPGTVQSGPGTGGSTVTTGTGTVL